MTTSRAFDSSRPPRRRRGRRGFTIIELLVVISIIAIIISLIVSAGTNLQAMGMEAETRGDLEVIQLAVNEYREQTGQWPLGSGPTLINRLMAVPACKEILRSLTKRALEGRDAFDNTIYFSSTGGRGGTPVVRSGGRDTKMNTADDLSSGDQ